MDAEFYNLKEFKTILANTYSLDEQGQTFVDFISDIHIIYNDLKEEILSYSINLDPSIYLRYSYKVIDELEKINSYDEFKDISTIEKWINKYQFDYRGIKSILQIVNYPTLYKEEGCPMIYYDLNGNISSAPEPYYDKLLGLQDDFLKFTKANLINDVINNIKESIKEFDSSRTKTLIDLSTSKATEKVIILEKLGVLKFLKEQEPFNRSTNALASVISGITGEKVETIQSYINPIGNHNVGQKNNPLRKGKTVNKVIQKLTSIGFNSIK